MNIINKLTLRHLRLNRSRTLITILGIALSAAMVCAVAGFTLSIRDLLRRSLIDAGGDYHIAYLDITAETAQAIAGEVVFSTSYTESGPSKGRVSVYLRLERPGRDYLEIAGSVAARHGTASPRVNKELLALEGAIARDNQFATFLWIAVILTVVVVGGSVVVIANAFMISASERVRQFGLLKSTGATTGQIRRGVLFEALALAAAAIPLGILLGFLIQAAALWLTNGLLREISMLNNGSLSFRVVTHPSVVAVTVAVSALTVLISAWLPARHAAKTSPMDAIRQTQSIKIRSERLKTSRLTKALFGFEGTLAAKSLKRSRGKYRATVVSLTVSVVLFISMSSFVWMINKSARMQYGGYDFDALVAVGGGPDVWDSVDADLRAIAGARLRLCQRTAFTTAVPAGFYTQKATQNGYAGVNPILMLYPMPDAAFEKIAPLSGGGLPGILINTTGTLKSGGKIKEFAPYDCAAGTTLTLTLGADDPLTLGEVTVAAVRADIPETIPGAFFAGEAVNVFIPETAYRQLFAAHEERLKYDTFTQYAVNAGDPDAFCDAAGTLLKPYLDDGVYVSVSNLTAMTRVNRNITLIVSLFGYGFIAMLSLIAVTSVVSTISTNMALRKQEFAMLYSAGMTAGGMDKMLNLESLLYGIKSLGIGLPLGVAFAYLTYLALGGTAEFPYTPPWFAMAVSAAAVFLLTFATMRYGKRKLRGVSIVEAIRNEVV